MKGAAHFISPGLCEFDEMCFVVHYLRENDLFADVGANVGAFTVLASGAAKARTVSFEPSPRTFAYLRRNIVLNYLGSLARPVHAAVGEKPGRLKLTENLGTENYICPPGHGGGVEVDVTTLDVELTEECPILMKVDVEGFESEVFGGAGKLLANPALRAMIVEKTGIGDRYGHNEGLLHRRIRSHGFIPCAYAAIERKLTQVSDGTQGNIVYVRNFQDTANRIRNAGVFSFKGATL